MTFPVLSDDQRALASAVAQYLSQVAATPDATANDIWRAAPLFYYFLFASSQTGIVPGEASLAFGSMPLEEARKVQQMLVEEI